LTRLIVVGVLLAAPLAAQAAGPYTLHRSSDPAQVEWSSAYATTNASPFIDAVGSLDDGLDYYYLVEDDQGGPVLLAVDKDESLGTVRLWFHAVFAGSPRDLAIVRLSELTAADGPFDSLIASLEPNAGLSAERVVDALDDALDALDLLRAGDVAFDPSAIDDLLASAVRELLVARDESGSVDPTPIDEMIEAILDVARLIAAHHIDLASASCGTCAAGGPSELCAAETALAAGDGARLQPHSDPELTVLQYGEAASRAIDALDSCP
jgi:hypothetical protein